MGFVPFTFIDFMDIILVAAIMYWIYRMTKGTNAPYIPVSYTHLDVYKRQPTHSLASCLPPK